MFLPCTYLYHLSFCFSSSSSEDLFISSRLARAHGFYDLENGDFRLSEESYTRTLAWVETATEPITFASSPNLTSDQQTQDKTIASKHDGSLCPLKWLNLEVSRLALSEYPNQLDPYLREAAVLVADPDAGISDSSTRMLLRGAISNLLISDSDSWSLETSDVKSISSSAYMADCDSLQDDDQSLPTFEDLNSIPTISGIQTIVHPGTITNLLDRIINHPYPIINGGKLSIYIHSHGEKGIYIQGDRQKVMYKFPDFSLIFP